jgi:hypothetical protein
MNGVIEPHQKIYSQLWLQESNLVRFTDIILKNNKVKEKYEKSLATIKTTIQYDFNLSHFNKNGNYFYLRMPQIWQSAVIYLRPF